MIGRRFLILLRPCAILFSNIRLLHSIEESSHDKNIVAAFVVRIIKVYASCYFIQPDFFSC